MTKVSNTKAHYKQYCKLAKLKGVSKKEVMTFSQWKDHMRAQYKKRILAKIGKAREQVQEKEIAE